jgi:hypothetical protein
LSRVALHYIEQGTSFDVTWPEIVGFLERSCNKGPLPCTPDDYKEACEKGSCQLWVAIKDHGYVGAAVTEVLSEPAGRVLVFLAIGGSGMNDWAYLEREIAEYARTQMDVVKVRGICRPGMALKIKPMGYRLTGMIMERQL